VISSRAAAQSGKGGVKRDLISIKRALMRVGLSPRVEKEESLVDGPSVSFSLTHVAKGWLIHALGLF